MTDTLERSRDYESFVVRNIHCAWCAATLQNEVASIPGVRKVEVDSMIGWTHIDFDSDMVTGEDLIAAVEAGGYEIVRTWE